MDQQTRKDLISIKTFIIEVIQGQHYNELDYEELNYIVSYIDYLLLGDIPYNKETLNTLQEGIIITSIYQNTPKLLKITGLLFNMIQKAKDEV